MCYDALNMQILKKYFGIDSYDMTRKDLCRTCNHVKATHNVIMAADDDDRYTHKTSRQGCSAPNCVCNSFKE
jgi:hypothetical protein